MKRRIPTITWMLAAVLALLLTAVPITAWAEGESSAAETPDVQVDDETPIIEPDPLTQASLLASAIAAIDKEAMFARQYSWEAVENLDFESANEDGSLSEWQYDWFITHDWSDYGHAIADFQPGDAVTVNGKTILILGKQVWEQGKYTNWDIYNVIGWDKVVFQTCLGDDEIWIVYGVTVHPTQEFLESHPAHD